MANGLSGNCVKCGTWRRSLHRDHIVPKFKGGPDEPSNIQLLCANCHEDKTAEDLKGQRPTPEQKERQRQAQLGSKRDETTKLRMSLAHLKKIAEDENYARGLRKMPNRNGTHDRICDGCGLRSKPGSLAQHQKASGHSGYREIPREDDSYPRGKQKTPRKKTPRRICNECGMETVHMALGLHQKATGHSGYTEVPNVL